MLGRNIQTFHFIYIHIFWRRSNNKATRSKVILHTTIRKATCRQHFIEKTVFQGRKKFFFLFFFCSSKENPFFEQKKKRNEKSFSINFLFLFWKFMEIYGKCVCPLEDEKVKGLAVCATMKNTLTDFYTFLLGKNICGNIFLH